jgi:hypothetical protein
MHKRADRAAAADNIRRIDAVKRVGLEERVRDQDA